MERLIEVVMRLWGQAGTSVLAKVLIILCLLTISLIAISKIMDGLAKLTQYLVDAIKAILARRVGGRRKSEWLNRKRQFLCVLASDLGSIGKAEAWNDQHFTDLEAEVEIDGRYYASSLRRLFRKKSFGKRKEPSLIKAIDASSEKCLILVGDPGAGKSVALRHLALRLIERSRKSVSELAPVPLYINLRELVLSSNQPICADSIKDFVIDNVRRGDVETAEYIKEHWRDFKERGIWFFLFDSFDEIPEVMHAAAGDQAVKKYSAAIREFMDGLDVCRGVLASREFKSPTALVWPKLRILPLSELLQDKLVNRTFLNSNQKEKVLRHISRSASAIYRNPLFLTLLCKYVKNHDSTPVNEHELLFHHVRSLTCRDDEYVSRTWSISPDSLWAGACELAKVLAMSPTLSLAPTVAEIIEVARRGGIGLDAHQIESLIEALTYVKIGRTDVASTDTNLRRFAFSHRRYQESLFASYLMNHPDEISCEDLIVDPRWREYLVALLQIARPEYVESVVRFASGYLDRHFASLQPTVSRYYGESIHSYNWNDVKLIHVLGLFLEARLYLPDGPWQSLQGPVEKLFGGAWRKGDYLDKLRVLQFCGVGSPQLLVRRVEHAIGDGISFIQEAALGACRFVVSPSEELASWVRRQVGARMVGSSRKFEMLRWEAVASDLPESFAIGVVILRAKYLFRFSTVIRAVLSVKSIVDYMVDGRASKRDRGAGQMLASRRGSAFVSFWFGYLTVLVASSAIILAIKVPRSVTGGGAFVILAALTIFLVVMMARLACLSEPRTLSPLRVIMDAWASFRAASMRLNITASVFLVATIALCLPGLVFYVICHIFSFFPEKGLGLIVFGSAAFYGLVFPVVIIVSLVLDRRARRTAQALRKSGLSFNAAVGSVKSSRELLAVCQSVDGSDGKAVRNAISRCSILVRIASHGGSVHGPSWLSRSSVSDIQHSLSALLVKSEAARTMSAE